MQTYSRSTQEITSACPIFVTDDSQRITYINEGARDLLGIDAEEALSGLLCYSLVGAREIDGTPLCGQRCRVSSSAQRGACPPTLKAIVPERLIGQQTSTGGWRTVEFQHVLLRDESGRHETMHIVRDIQRMDAVLQFAEQVLSASQTLVAQRSTSEENPLRLLTAQERRVVRLVAEGRSTGEMSKALGVSAPTIRNHLQHVFKKFDCHSRLEVAARARPYLASPAIELGEQAIDLFDV